MRVLLHLDMEGISGVTTFRELMAVYPEYWWTGRDAMTADAAAAADGLLAGGASEVVVDDQHASGSRNVIDERMPDGVARLSSDEIWRRQRAGEFDATFQVGRHARRGTPGAFVSHTMLPGMSVAIDGAPVTESHIFAWRAGLPLLGITGDDRLGGQIDGSIAGTPYLAVKEGLSRGSARPCRPTPEANSAAIHDFARACARDWRARSVPVLPPSFTLTARLSEPVAARAAGNGGLERIDPTTVSARATGWWAGGEDALQAVMAALGEDLWWMFAGLDLSSEASAMAIDPARSEPLRSFMERWIDAGDPPEDA